MSQCLLSLSAPVIAHDRASFLAVCRSLVTFPVATRGSRGAGRLMGESRLKWHRSWIKSSPRRPPRSNTPHDDAGSQQRNTPGGIWGRSSGEDQEAKKFRAFRFFLTPKIQKSEKLHSMYVGVGASAVVRQLLLLCRNYDTVKYIRRNCRNYGRKAPGPVVIHRQAGNNARGLRRISPRRRQRFGRRERATIFRIQLKSGQEVEVLRSHGDYSAWFGSQKHGVGRLEAPARRASHDDLTSSGR